MHAMNLPLQLDEIRAQLEQAKLEAECLTSGLSDTQLWRRPPDGGWSVGECLVDLYLVDEPYLPKLRTAVADARTKGQTGRGPFTFGFLGKRFVRSQTVDGRKVSTSKIFEPKPDPNVLARFVRLQDALLTISKEAAGLDLARATFTTPNLPLRLSLFEALNLLVVHQERHFAQAARMRETFSDAVS